MGSFAFGLVSALFFIIAGNVGLMGIQWMEQGADVLGLGAIAASMVLLLLAYVSGVEGIKALK